MHWNKLQDNTKQPFENIYSCSMSNNCETISQAGRHSIFKKHPLKYPSPWQQCLSQLHQGQLTMHTSFILSYKVLRTVGCQQKGQQFQALQQGWDQALSDFQNPPHSVPEPRGKGENYVITLSHEWFNSSHWRRYIESAVLANNLEGKIPISYFMYVLMF